MSSSSQNNVRVCIFPDTGFSRFLFNHSFNFYISFGCLTFLSPPPPLSRSGHFQIFQNISRRRLKVYFFRPLALAPRSPSLIRSFSNIQNISRCRLKVYPFRPLALAPSFTSASYFSLSLVCLFPMYILVPPFERFVSILHSDSPSRTPSPPPPPPPPSGHSQIFRNTSCCPLKVYYLQRPPLARQASDNVTFFLFISSLSNDMDVPRL